MKSSAVMWAVVPDGSRSLSSALGMFDNHDADGLRLYGLSEVTLFRRKCAAKKEALIWPKSKVVRVRLVIAQ